MSFLERNLAALSASAPSVGEVLRTHYAPSPRWAAERASSGVPTARVAGKLLHSRHDPVREAVRLVDAAESNGAGCTVILGFGLGYHVEAALARPATDAVVVVEPRPEYFLSALATRELGHVLSSPRLRLLLDAAPGAVAQALREFEHLELTLVRMRSLYELSAPYFDEVTAVLEAFRWREEINSNTLRRFGRLWVRNLTHNIKRIATAPGVALFADRFHGIPAVVLGAGPSLDSILPRITELRERAILVAVDTALPALAEHGVEPDFAVVVDPQYWNTRHLDRVSHNKTVLVSESSTHPRVFRMLDTASVFCSSLFPLGAYLEEAVEQKGKLGAGGSVSTTAWDFARLLGSAPIYLAGIDLGFPGGRTHCSGSFFEMRVHTLSSRLQPAEGAAYRYLHDADPHVTRDNRGGQVITDRRMELYRWWFENQAKIHPEAESRNLSAGGTAIDGMPFACLDDVIAELPQCRNQFEGNLEALRRTVAERRAEQEPVARLAAGCELLLSELSRLEETARRGLSLCEDSLTAEQSAEPQKGLAASLSALEQIDREIRGFPHRDIVGFLAHGVLKDIIAAPEEQATPRDVLKRNATLYRELALSASYHRKLLGGAHHRLKESLAN